jgi:hypothetical protein
MKLHLLFDHDISRIASTASGVGVAGTGAETKNLLLADDIIRLAHEASIRANISGYAYSETFPVVHDMVDFALVDRNDSDLTRNEVVARSSAVIADSAIGFARQTLKHHSFRP